MMKKSIKLGFILITLIGISSSILTSFFLLPTQQVNAANTNNFKPGNIMDDYLFTDKNSMSASQIQSFLVAKGSTCLINFKTLALYDDNGDGLGDEPYGRGVNQQVSAATLIWQAAQLYRINPKVILATLQKEQSLITRGDCPNWRYSTALGYGCHDNEPCDVAAYGFTRQIDYGVWHFRGFFDDKYPVPPITPGSRFIYYNPNSSCGGTTINIQNRATAALYSYTPYQPNSATLAANPGQEVNCGAYGNLNFWRTYNDWFGSTKYPQPIGAMIYRQSSNGKIYLATNNKRFYISSTTIMANYNIDGYRTIPASDTTISSIEDGGALTNTIIDDSGNIYIVNNGYRHKIPSADVCTNWNIDCFNSNVVRNLGSAFSTVHLKSGSSINNTAYYDGIYYRMDLGKRLPYANKQSFIDSGFSTSSAVKVGAINFNKPLGKLQITTPGLLKFSPKNTIYYFNGTEYYTVTSMSIYDAWALDKVASIAEPLSSYNSTDDVVSTKSLGYWAQTSSGDKYVINNGDKMKLNTSQQSLWPTASYIDGLDSLISGLPSTVLGSFIKNGINYYQLMPSLGEKRYIAGMADYKELGGNSANTTRLNNTLSSSIESGPFAFANGRLIKVEGGTTIYVIDNGELMHVASMGVLSAYKFDTSKMKVYPPTSVDEYEKLGQLRSGILPDGGVVIPYKEKLIKISSSQTASFGFNTDGHMNISLDLINKAELLPATQLMRNSDDGRIYYGNDGSLHYIGSATKLQQISGGTIPITPVNASIIDMFTIGDPA